MESQTSSNMKLTTWTIKEDCCKAYIGTYQLSDCIKAGVHLGEESFFHTAQIVP